MKAEIVTREVHVLLKLTPKEAKLLYDFINFGSSKNIVDNIIAHHSNFRHTYEDVEEGLDDVWRALRDIQEKLEWDR